MTKPTVRVHEIREVRGPTTIEPSQGPRPPSAVRAVRRRWAEVLAPLKDDPWSACPPACVREVLAALSLDINTAYGSHATSQAMQILAATAAPQATAPLHFRVATGSSYLEMTLARVPMSHASSAASPETTMEVSVSEANQDLSAHEILEAVATSPESPPRLSIDAFTQLPDSEIISAVRQVEAWLGKDELGVLLGTVALLRQWAMMDGLNAATGESRYEGLTKKDVEVCPGWAVVMSFRQQGWESGPTVPQEEQDSAVRAQVRYRPH